MEGHYWIKDGFWQLLIVSVVNMYEHLKSDLKVIQEEEFRRSFSAKEKDDVWSQNIIFIHLLKFILVSELNMKLLEG